MHRDQRSGWLLLVMAGILVGVIAFGMIYINRKVAASEARDCATLRADIIAVESAGQLTETGAAVTMARRVRYAQIPCSPPLPPPTFETVQSTTPR